MLGSVNGYYSSVPVRFVDAEGRDLLVASLEKAGVCFGVIDGGRCHSRLQLLDAIGGALLWPGGAGNMDALRDLLVEPGEDCVVFVENARSLWCELTGEAGMLVEIWTEVARIVASSDRPKLLVFIL